MCKMVYVIIQPGNVSFPHGVKGVRTTMSDAYDMIEHLRNTEGGSYSVVPTNMKESIYVPSMDGREEMGMGRTRRENLEGENGPEYER